MSRTVLVAYGTRNGSTAEIARVIASVLRDSGLETDVRPAAEVGDVAPYDAVVLGGALYTGRWHRDASRFTRQHRQALAERPVWLFSSGPLDPSASERDLPPVPGARRAQRRTQAREHVTFGGRLEAGARGRIARMILEQGRGGDYRDMDRISAWATEIADGLAVGAQRP
ncbi:flavodoxin domain-containing protein [Streptomyces sp. NPDC057136]|uniref:flavodoxin domain-containing protein n=1 Tax=Streptomyces sp. NPDC057136 TaxID=3346029 RepID=UPI00363AAE38